MSKQARNELCACGSGKKYKQCCLNQIESKVNRPSGVVIERLRTAWMNFNVGRLDHASQICSNILKDKPDQLDATYLQGLIALKDGRVDLAIKLLQLVVKKDSNKSVFMSSLGLAYHERGLMDLAVKAYQTAIDLDPKNIDAYYNLHAAKINSIDLSESIKCLSKIIELNPKDFDALFMLGMLRDYQQKTDGSEFYFDQLKTSPVIEARINAWHYIKANTKKLPQITGSIVETFKIAMDFARNEGLILEFGVRYGNSIKQLAELTDQKIYGFDSFEGIPEDWHNEKKGSYTTKGFVPKVPSNVTLIKGWFDQTLDEFLSTNFEPVRLINIDCDIYSSTKTVLSLLAPRMRSGTVIIFDEYIGNQHWQEDEFKAFQEVVRERKWKYEYIAFSFY